MLTQEIANVPTDESPTFGVVDDGRQYPAVTARKRQQNGSKRETLYTVSKHGLYAELYPKFEREVIEPYRQRRRKRGVGSGYPYVNSVNTDKGGMGQNGAKSARRNRTDIPVNSLDG